MDFGLAMTLTLMRLLAYFIYMSQVRKSARVLDVTLGNVEQFVREFFSFFFLNILVTRSKFLSLVKVFKKTVCLPCFAIQSHERLLERTLLAGPGCQP